MSVLNIGDCVLIRTVTFYYLGRVRNIADGFVWLEESSWLPDTVRWTTLVTTGALSDVELLPYGVGVSLASIVDVSPWRHALPTEAK